MLACMQLPFRCAFATAVVPAAAAACGSSLFPAPCPALVLGKGDGDGTSRAALDDVPMMIAWPKNVHHHVCACVCENMDFCSLFISSTINGSMCTHMPVSCGELRGEAAVDPIRCGLPPPTAPVDPGCPRCSCWTPFALAMFLVLRLQANAKRVATCGWAV